MNNWNIPEKLKSLDFWLTWQFKTMPGQAKPVKKPNINPGPWDNKKFYSFSGVLTEFNRCQLPTNQSRADGIGIAFTTTNDIVGIDIDNVNDTDIPAEIKSILLAGKSGYIEKSVSGKGFHIIGTTSNKKLLLDAFKRYNNGTGKKSADKKVELYVADHYFTVSGNVVNNTFGNIDIAIALAWEYTTQTPLINSVASIFNQRSGTTQNSVAGTVNKRSENTKENSVASIKTSVAYTLPPHPADAFTDEEILTLKLMPMKKAINFMYKGKPTLKDILETDGINESLAAFTTDKDSTRSGIDMEIVSAVVFWLYRYDTNLIIDFLTKSKINRTDKHNVYDYFERTINKAKSTAIEFFPATYGLSEKDWKKLKRWQEWKKECAKAIKNV